MDISKRGQFYLIAAIVLIIIILGFAAYYNYAQEQSYSRTYDISKELEIESAQVQQFGIYNENIGVEQMKSFLEGFIYSYGQEVGAELDELYFIFGNEGGMVFMGFQKLNESLTTEIQTNDETYSILEIRKGEIYDLDLDQTGIETVGVNIGYEDSVSEYDFKLKEGENFYFILTDVVGDVETGEKYVVVSKN